MTLLHALSILSVFLFAKVEMHQLGSNNFTTERFHVVNSLFQPWITEYKNSIVYVSFPEKFTIKLESSNFINKPCEIPSEVIKNNNGTNVTVTDIDTLGNGKIVVSLVTPIDNAPLSDLWMYIVDPANCTFNTVKLIVDVPQMSPRNDLNVVTYNESYDLFVKSETCGTSKICKFQYDDTGNLITKGIVENIPQPEGVWTLMSLEDYTSTNGYLYVDVLDNNNSTVLRRLDDKFKSTSELTVNNTESIIYWTDEEDGIFCYHLSNVELECIFVDSKLNVQSTTKLTYKDKYIQYYYVIQQSNQNAIVVTILSDYDDGKNPSTYVQYLHKNGHVTDPVVFQERICPYDYDIMGIKFDNDLSCVNVLCNNFVSTRCIGAPEHREF